MKELTPKQIVNELDKYVIGQDEAKKAVAIALRNRYRRSLLNEEFKEEIKPKNILMIGPTGVGKTEIARRLAKLVKAPFVKVEATKYTEVGYVGRDVESMVRDLVETSIRMVKNEKIGKVYDKAMEIANEKIIEILIPLRSSREGNVINPLEVFFSGGIEEKEKREIDENIIEKRQELKRKLLKGELEDRIIEIEVEETKNQTVEMFNGLGLEEFHINMGDIFGGIIPKKKKKRKVSVKEARKIIASQEAQKLIDMDEGINDGIKRAEEHGIIFIDEIDKIAGRGYGAGPDVSREGVQRDILPIIEGSTVMTKYGPVKTDHILFIAAGAFHVTKITDLIPEIQGRFPIRVELESLKQENFKEILTKPRNALIKQYQLLMETEGIKITFTEEAINEIAKIAYLVNEQSENIGARRLHTIIEKLMEEISFKAPDLESKDVIVHEDYVKEKLKPILKERNITKYIL